MLSDIVLVHELVHWIMHWLRNRNASFGESKQQVTLYKSMDNINYHEAFAELISYFCFKGKKEEKLF